MARCLSCMQIIPDTAADCPLCGRPVPCRAEQSNDLTPGTLLHSGRYVIGRAIGHGGYGITYIAYDNRMAAVRAIKEYFPRNGRRLPDASVTYTDGISVDVQRTRANFLSEARMMNQANGNGHSPHIVQCFDQFDENNTSYILMEYLEGCTFDDAINRQHAPFPWKTAVSYTVQALEGLSELHARGIIHRDISCSNLFLSGTEKEQVVKLIDFGSAATVQDAKEHPELLRRSVKHPYTAPEQENQKPQGFYTDIYAMAAVLYKLVAGRVSQEAYGRELPSLSAAVPEQRIPKALDRLLVSASRVEPAERIQTADVMRRKLEGILRGAQLRPRLIAVAAVAAAAGGAVLWLTSPKSAPQGENLPAAVSAAVVTATSTQQATASPSPSPTATGAPTAAPTAAPTSTPTTAPSASPTAELVLISTETASLTASPTPVPTETPTAEPVPAVQAEVQRPAPLSLCFVDAMAEKDALTVTDPADIITIRVTGEGGQRVVLHFGNDERVRSAVRIPEGENSATRSFHPAVFGIREDVYLPQEQAIWAAYEGEDAESADMIWLYASYTKRLVQPVLTLPESAAVGDSLAIGVTGSPESEVRVAVIDQATGMEAASASAQTDGSGQASLSVPVSAQWGLSEGESRAFTVVASYPDAAQEDAPVAMRTLTVSRPSVARPVLLLNGQAASTLVIGLHDLPLRLTATGCEPGERMILMRESGTPMLSADAADGTADFGELTAQQFLGEDSLRLYVGYLRHDARSETVHILLDQAAEPIRVTDAAIDERTQAISGSAEASAYLYLEADNGMVAETFATEDGRFSMEELHLSGAGELTILETDAFGNTARLTLPVEHVWAGLALVFDDGSVDAQTDTRHPMTVMISGEPESAVLLHITVNEQTQTEQLTADRTGKAAYAFRPSMQPGEEQTYTLTASYADTEALVAGAANELSIRVSCPEFQKPTLRLSGRVEGDNVVGPAELPVNVLVEQAEPGERLTVLINEQKNMTITADDSGQAVYPLDAAAVGEASQLWLRVRYESQPQVISAPYPIAVDRAVTTLSLDATDIREDTVRLTGQAETGATIDLIVGQATLAETVAVNGQFMLDDLNLWGVESLTLLATDPHGNTLSEVLEIAHVLAKPELTVAEGSTPDSFEVSVTAEPEKQLRLILTGTAGAAAGQAFDITTDENGVYSGSISLPEMLDELDWGASRQLLLTAVYTDDEQPALAMDAPVRLTLKKAKLTVPVLSFAEAWTDDLTVSLYTLPVTVHAENITPGATVRLMLGDTEALEETLTGGSVEYAITAEDVSAADRLVIQLIYPDRPAVTSNQLTLRVDRRAEMIVLGQDTVTEDTKTITGVAEAYATIGLTDDLGQNSFSVSANENGFFRIEGLRLKGVNFLLLTEADPYGNGLDLTVPVEMGYREPIVLQGQFSDAETLVYGRTDTLLLEGTADPGRALYINCGSETYRTQVDTRGNWRCNLLRDSSSGAKSLIEVGYEDGYGEPVTRWMESDYETWIKAETDSIPSYSSNIQVQVEPGASAQAFQEDDPVSDRTADAADGLEDGWVSLKLDGLRSSSVLRLVAEDAHGNTDETGVDVQLVYRFCSEYATRHHAVSIDMARLALPFNPATVYLTGWELCENGTEAMHALQAEFYLDAELKQPVRTVYLGTVTQRMARSLEMGVTFEKGSARLQPGFVIAMNLAGSDALPDGEYYLLLTGVEENDPDHYLGPFAITLDSTVTPTRKTEMK